MWRPGVTKLDAPVERLAAAGIAVERRPDWETDYGRFARVHDPEGLPIELWERLTLACVEGAGKPVQPGGQPET